MFLFFLGSDSITVVSDRQKEQIWPMTIIVYYNIIPSISALHKLCIACEFSVCTEYPRCPKSIESTITEY